MRAWGVTVTRGCSVETCLIFTADDVHDKEAVKREFLANAPDCIPWINFHEADISGITAINSSPGSVILMASESLLPDH